MQSPNQASVILPDGMQIPCAIFEDPDPDKDGLRQFWLEPLRPLPAGTTSAKLFIDVLPPRCRVNIKLPGVLNGHLRASWRDQYGEHSDQPVQRTPPDPEDDQHKTGPAENGNRFGNGQGNGQSNGQNGVGGQDIRDNG